MADKLYKLNYQHKITTDAEANLRQLHMNKEESQARNPEKRSVVPENIFKDRGQTGSRQDIQGKLAANLKRRKSGLSQWL